MPLITSPTATCTVAANTNSVTIAGLDLNYVKPGMLLHIGSRQKLTGDGYIINTVTPSGTSGGTLATVGDIPNAATSTPFLVNALAFNGDGASLGLSWISRLVNRLTSLTGSGSSYDSASRVIELDRETSAALSRLVFKTAGVQKFAVELRAISGVDCLDFRVSSDGTNWASAFYIRLDTGSVVTTGRSAILAAQNGRQFSVGEWLELSESLTGEGLVGQNLGVNRLSGTYYTSRWHETIGYSALRFRYGVIESARQYGATAEMATVAPTWNPVWDGANFRRPDIGPWQALLSVDVGLGVVLPSGGTWAYALNYIDASNFAYNSAIAGVAAGGATVGGSPGFRLWGFGWRIA